MAGNRFGEARTLNEGIMKDLMKTHAHIRFRIQETKRCFIGHIVVANATPLWITKAVSLFIPRRMNDT
jgi:hypothetical protein